MPASARVALITGGASGIGRATALRLAASGMSVLIADLDAEAGEAAARAVHATEGEGAFIRCDVGDETSVAAAVRTVGERFGALHVLVTSAGILEGAYRPVAELEQSTFHRVLEVNVAGTFLACKHAAPLIEASGGGVIICVASAGGVRGPSSSLAYGASKAAVHGFCLTLEQQLAPRGIRVNVVCPGSLDTAMKRKNLEDRAASLGLDPETVLAEATLGDPDGLARILAFLASDAADYVRGTIFTR